MAQESGAPLVGQSPSAHVVGRLAPFLFPAGPPVILSSSEHWWGP